MGQANNRSLPHSRFHDRHLLAVNHDAAGRRVGIGRCVRYGQHLHQLQALEYREHGVGMALVAVPGTVGADVPAGVDVATGSRGTSLDLLPDRRYY